MVLGAAPETYGDDPSCLQVRVSGKCLRMTRRKVPATEEWSKLPPLEHVPHDKKLYSLSNRRLFIYRVLFHHHKLSTVEAYVFHPRAARVSQHKYDNYLKRMPSKWDRSFSTKYDGERVLVHRSVYGVHIRTSGARCQDDVFLTLR